MIFGALGVDGSSVDMHAVRVGVAEFLATALLVGVGCAACTSALSHDSAKFAFTSNLGFGLVVGLLVQVLIFTPNT